jgi:hypothetical protein
MAPYLDDVLKTIRLPDLREPDIRAGRERFFRLDAGPHRWLRVVIQFGRGVDFVVTAFGQITDPRLGQ